MDFPEEINLKLRKIAETRYGENPQQDGAVYETVDGGGNLQKILPITGAEKLQGKKMSFNNWLDADAVLKMLWQFEEPFATVFKHLNPAGACQNDDILKAYKKAWNCDPMSAFGGIAGVNRKITEEIAEYAIDGKFLEAIIAPSYGEEALEILQKKKKLRILEIDTEMPQDPGPDLRPIHGGFLVQEFDYSELTSEDLIYLEDRGIRKPTEEQIEDMLFGWKINRRTKSNTVLLVKDKATIGIGAGQQNRVDAGFIAGYRANKPYKKLTNMDRTCESSKIKDLADYIGLKTKGRTKNSVAVSSAFYPFPDTIEVLNAFGVEASLSPAGSIRDKESYEALRKHDMAAAHTPQIEKGGYKGGMRAFLH
ncbi:hypothetical protein AKJ36_00350 [candidate division MSBL1 archaeon SCGC-AAA259I07]|uniref:IMP cyclohydrolase n=2 Tax=candidate division MSBL1 TaxID=215777 RepID=A0A133U912_9EURY|nr:hypothetical protein AKJ61_00135 [candidate division MSBL1 archaeon SCGC-AAA259B11]KXA95530.1 hypothetical protein AKJ36_00350 [candidate division MSBL1 archaeon SCGC-AAA259I07]